jgi:hypothetical protein
MHLNEKQRLKLYESLTNALVSAFNTLPSLSQMTMSVLEVDLLVEIGYKDNLRGSIFELVRWADSQGFFEKLIEGAYVRNPGNSLMQELVENLPDFPSFLTDCVYDIYLSCAEDVPEDWLTKFRRSLTSSIINEIKSPVAVTGSRQVVSETSADAEVKSSAAKAGALIIIFSDGYLQSAKCVKELDDFLTAHSPHDFVERLIFLVEYKKVNTSFSNNLILNQLRGYRFWDYDENYYKYIKDLSNDAAALLRGIKDGAWRDIKPDNQTVFVAEVAEDLQLTRDAVIRHLIQAGINILPVSRYPTDPQKFTEAVNKDISKCKLFVQLLGSENTVDTSRLPAEFITLQYESAQRAGKPIMQWRRADLIISDIQDEQYRKFLGGNFVRAEGIEEFKSAVVNFIFPPPPLKLPSEWSDKFVFVNNTDDDSNWVEEKIIALLEEKGIGYSTKLNEGDAANANAFLKAALTGCDALFLVYGAAPPDWVLNQLLICKRHLALRDRPLQGFILCDGPPPHKADFPAKLPGLKSINCRENTNELNQFIDSLRNGGDGE